MSRATPAPRVLGEVTIGDVVELAHGVVARVMVHKLAGCTGVRDAAYLEGRYRNVGELRFLAPETQIARVLRGAVATASSASAEDLDPLLRR